MASSALWGFVSGFSKSVEKQLADRQDEEKEKRKLLLLQELQRQQSDYEYNRAMGEVDNQLTDKDYSTGKVTFKNKRGDVLRTEDMSADEMKDYQYKQQKQDVDLQKDKKSLDVADAQIENFKSEAANRAAELGIQQQQLGISRQRVGLEQQQLDLQKTGGFTNTLDQRAHELLYQNKDIVEQVAKQGVPMDVIAKVAKQSTLQAAAHAKNGQNISLQDTFIGALTNLRNAAKKDRDRKGGPVWSLDPTTTGN